MQVTFRANSNVLGYKAGKVYTEELTPLLKAVLLSDTHLSLIDPPTLEVRRPEPQKEIEVEKPKTVKKTVETKEHTDGSEEEDIQDSDSSGTA